MALNPNDPVVVAIRNQLDTLGQLDTAIAQETVNGVQVGQNGLQAQLKTLPQLAAAVGSLQQQMAALGTKLDALLRAAGVTP